MFFTGVLSRGFIKRSEDSVSAPSSYLPSADDYEEDALPGYSSDDLPGYSSDDGSGYSADSETDYNTELTEASDGETTTEHAETTTLGDEDLIRYNAGLDELPGSGDGEDDLSEYDPSEESTTPAPKLEADTSDPTTGAEAAEAAEPSASFLSYSALSPAVSLCPGGSVEICVTVCPGSSGRVYGACVQGCADRCGGELP